MLFKLTSAKYLLVAALSLTLVVAIACGGAEESAPAAPAAPAAAAAPKAAAPAEKKEAAKPAAKPAAPKAAAAAAPAKKAAPAAAAAPKKKTVNVVQSQAAPTATESTQAVAQKPLLPADQQILKPLRYGCCNTMPYREGGWGRMFMQWTAMQPMKFNKMNGLEPHLALSYELSSDGLTYTLSLDPDAIFQDGTPVTAADVKKAWEFGSMPEQQVSWGGLVNNLKDVQGIEVVKTGEGTTASGLVAVDDHTLQIVLNKPDPVYPKKLAQWLMGVWKAAQAEQDPDWVEHPIGVGPFTVTADLDAKYIELQRTDNWWKDAPTIIKVELPAVPDKQTQMVMFENAEVDVIFSSPGFQAEPHDPAHKFHNLLYRIPYGGIYYYALDHSKPPLDDQNMRAAIAHGHDQNLIVKSVFGFGGIPAYGLVTPETACYQDESENPGYVYDPDKAREFLGMSKYADGTIPPMLISLPAGYDDNWVRYTEAMQAQLKENLGLDLKIQVYERGQTPPDSNFSRRSMGITTADPAYPIWLQGHSASPTNQSRSKFVDPELDKLIEIGESLGLNDPARCEAWQAAEKRFLEGYHLLPTIQVNYPYLAAPWVNNFDMSVNNDFSLDVISLSERVFFDLAERRRK